MINYPWFKFAHEKNLLTNYLIGLYSNPATPHCVVGFGRPVHLAHSRANSGFFVRTIQVFCVMAGLNGEAFGLASSKCWSTNPYQSCHHLLGRSGDGFKHLHLESAIMQNQSLGQVRPFALVCSFQVPTTDLNPDFTPSITVVIGAYQSQEEVIAARNAISSPALISASLYQSFESNASDALGGAV